MDFQRRLNVSPYLTVFYSFFVLLLNATGRRKIRWTEAHYFYNMISHAYLRLVQQLIALTLQTYIISKGQVILSEEGSYIYGYN